MLNFFTPILAAGSTVAPSYKSIDSFGEAPGVSEGFSNMGTHLSYFANTVMQFGIWLLAIVTVLIGIGCIFGGVEYKEKLRKVFPWMLGATALMVLARSIANVVLKAGGLSGGALV